MKGERRIKERNEETAKNNKKVNSEMHPQKVN